MTARRLMIFTVLTFVFSLSAHAGGFGLQVDYNHFLTDNNNNFQVFSGGDFGIGARAEFGTSHLALVLSGDYYFINGEINDLKFYELNANLQFTFPTEGFKPYIGGGVGLARASLGLNFFDESESETGWNLLGGIKFGGAGINPFIEVRYVIYGSTQAFDNRFVLTGGIIF
jgi:opacity protein-like surface antigen